MGKIPSNFEQEYNLGSLNLFSSSSNPLSVLSAKGHTGVGDLTNLLEFFQIL